MNRRPELVREGACRTSLRRLCARVWAQHGLTHGQTGPVGSPPWSLVVPWTPAGRCPGRSAGALRAKTTEIV
eukprot:5540078-Prymnesium_polylepis.1